MKAVAMNLMHIAREKRREGMRGKKVDEEERGEENKLQDEIEGGGNQDEKRMEVMLLRRK